MNAMRKTIIFPTDFSIQSLNIVKSVLSSKSDNERFNIILLHGLDMGDSITDLLFNSKTQCISELSNSEFDDACEIIRNKFESRIRSIRKDLFTGFSQAAFDHYVQANRVTEAYLPVNYQLQLTNGRSFDIVPYILNSGLVLNEVAWQENPMMPEKGQLAEVFHNQMAY
jgi:hypothetical protein